MEHVVPILHVLIVRYMDGTPGRVVIGPFDGSGAVNDFIAASRAKLEEKYGDDITFGIEPLVPSSCVFE